MCTSMQITKLQKGKVEFKIKKKIIIILFLSEFHADF